MTVKVKSMLAVIMAAILGIIATRPVETSRHITGFIDDEDEDTTGWTIDDDGEIKRKKAEATIGIRG